MVHLLLKLIDMTALMNAINKNNATLVGQLIENGADVNELDSNQDAPLVIAAYKGYDQIVKSLLDAGADVTAVDPGMKATALHAAAYAGRNEAAKLLIAYHIDINKQGPYNGYTALHDAIWQNNVEVVKTLLDANADLKLLSNDHKSALELAKSKNRKEIVALIQSKMEK
ncbi:ankyrin repeat domain-containing protein [Dyadobacter psychrotolerans]|uniref:Ankyrin repeat domain-containing protein n=1 Tax=Dyadobacter psychrotolerans TaxID=2541721 RepID=A0A4R5DKV5_9BACT|nr:ankyrin repeat domain-containing protein [Dyadobacter psychrotolerans]TDE14832.1 ankyrin repeat domain-containing protein [Dyadobacter psychrotolerans]